MRRTALTLSAALLVSAAVACSPSDETEPPPSPETAPEPASSSEPASPPPPGAVEDGETTETPSVAPTIATEVQPEAVLPAEVLGSLDEPRQDTPGVTAWRLPQGCQEVVPEALDMWTVSQGSGELEQPVGMQQVAVFTTADAATAAADELLAAMESCVAGDGAPTRYLVEPVDIGAQGNGLVTDYNGVSADGDLDTALGSYVAQTRRGTAVTLTGYEGGENQVGTARQDGTALLANAWERLCLYDSEGC